MWAELVGAGVFGGLVGAAAVLRVDVLIRRCRAEQRATELLALLRSPEVAGLVDLEAYRVTKPPA